MSALKKMPNEKPMRTFRYYMWGFVIAVAVALGYLRQHGEPSGSVISDTLTVILFVGFAAGVIYESYQTQHKRCPECGQKMREVYEDFHPRAEEYHLLYCNRCDTIWDTTIPKSSG